MFVANTLTVWIEALRAVFDSPTYPQVPGLPSMKNIPITTEYPQNETDYPGMWVNFSMQGDLRNVGIGHVEYMAAPGGFQEAYRWRFNGFVEITLAAMTNLERALLIDEMTRTIAVARVDENREGVLRATVEQNDLVGMNVTWESFTISGFGESQGTPWGTDDVIYEATVTLVVEGEVVLNPVTGLVVPLSAIVIMPQRTDETPSLPAPGVDGWK